MSHDLRQALGYRRLPTSDPKEQALRDRWYAAETPEERSAIDRELSDYLWKRTMATVEADRKKHPRAKRNLPVGAHKEQSKAPDLPNIPALTAP